MRNSRNKNNHKTNRKQRHRNHTVLLKRTALNSHAVASQITPVKSYSPPNKKKGRDISESNLWKPKAVIKSDVPVMTTGASNNMNEKEKTTDTGGKANLSGNIHRWYHNPRITGAVAAVLLFAMLAIAIIPTTTNVRAEEQAETAVLDPVRQLGKEYVYAGSRMLAIEDYGLSSTSTPSPTPSLTPTPTPETPTPTPPTPTPTPDTPTPTPTPEPPTPTPTPATPTPTPPPPTPTPCNAPRKIQDECRRDGGVWDNQICDCVFPE